MNRKAQIHMTETIAVLFIFFILLFFGLIFYYKYVDASLAEKMEENLARRAREMTNAFFSLPEIQCTSGLQISLKEYCLDVLKLEAFREVLEEDREEEDYYFNVFSFAKITIQEVYPDASRSWILYDKPKKNFAKPEKDSAPKKVIPVSTALVRELDTTRSGPMVGFGYVIIEVYS